MAHNSTGEAHIQLAFALVSDLAILIDELLAAVFAAEALRFQVHAVDMAFQILALVAQLGTYDAHPQKALGVYGNEFVCGVFFFGFWFVFCGGG